LFIGICTLFKLIVCIILLKVCDRDCSLSSKKERADKEEAEDAGLFFSQSSGNPEYYSFSTEEIGKLRAVLGMASYNRGAVVGVNQLVWSEGYTYDANGNRASKTTPWGVINYTYDAENRLLTKGTVVYKYDAEGNLLSEKGLRKRAA
jgi:YD repeat-containing protein